MSKFAAAEISFRPKYLESLWTPVRLNFDSHHKIAWNMDTLRLWRCLLGQTQVFSMAFQVLLYELEVLVGVRLF